MKVLQIIQRYFEIMGISSWQQSTQKYSSRVLIGFLLFGLELVSHFVYIIFVANGYMEYMECVSSTSGSFIIFVCFATAAIKSNILFKIIDNIERFIVNRCEYPKSKKYFTKVNQQIDRLSELIFSFVLKIVVQVAMLPKPIASFVIYFTTDSGSESFQLPFPLWFPFDSNQPIGYLITVILQYIILGYEFLVNACICSLGIGIYWFIISSTKRINRIVHKISTLNTQTNKNELNRFKLFAEFIYAHRDMKQVANDFSDLFQPIYMTLFTWSLLVISGALLVIHGQISRHEDDLSALVIPVGAALIALSLTFISCEIGERMNYAFGRMNFTLDQLDWYLFPIELKRIFPMIVEITQQPVELACFGSITCTRIAFKQVVNSAFSYFMMLRQFVE